MSDEWRDRKGELCATALSAQPAPQDARRSDHGFCRRLTTYDARPTTHSPFTYKTNSTSAACTSPAASCEDTASAIAPPASTASCCGRAPVPDRPGRARQPRHRPAQRFFQNFSLDGKLILVRSVLVVASAAPLKVWAPRPNPAGRRLNHPFQPRPRKPRLLLSQLRFHGFALKREGDEDALTRTLLVRRQARQPLTAINLLFDFQLHMENSSGRQANQR